MVRARVKRELIAWAVERSRIPFEDLLSRFPALTKWERGDADPTLKQLEEFAQATHTPLGFFFLQTPPAEPIPIPDFRTIHDVVISRPSPDLLDTVYQCQQRQDWYRQYGQMNLAGPVPLVGSLSHDVSITEAAARMRTALSFDIAQRGANWSEALRILREMAESQGVLVMVNGIVGNNTHRKLDPQEFRGFALVDDWAPLVFVNGADTKAAQIFTLAHELAHIWLGESALSDADLTINPTHAMERFCNQVAAEFLVPLEVLRRMRVDDALRIGELERLARTFKVSTLVVLRRLYDSGALTFDRYRQAYADERKRVLAMMEQHSDSEGGNFYYMLPVRVSRRFARALIASTLEGQTLHRDALQMLGFSKISTFHELAHRLGVEGRSKYRPHASRLE